MSQMPKEVSPEKREMCDLETLDLPGTRDQRSYSFI